MVFERDIPSSWDLRRELLQNQSIFTALVYRTRKMDDALSFCHPQASPLTSLSVGRRALQFSTRCALSQSSSPAPRGRRRASRDTGTHEQRHVTQKRWKTRKDSFRQNGFPTAGPDGNGLMPVVEKEQENLSKKNTKKSKNRSDDVDPRYAKSAELLRQLGEPPHVKSGYMGWLEEDDEYWRNFRKYEKMFRGPHIPELDPSKGPKQPLDRNGNPVEYPAAAMFDPEIGEWRPTTEEEEAKLRGFGPYDPYYVPEMSVDDPKVATTPWKRKRVTSDTVNDASEEHRKDNDSSDEPSPSSEEGKTQAVEQEKMEKDGGKQLSAPVSALSIVPLREDCVVTLPKEKDVERSRSLVVSNLNLIGNLPDKRRAANTDKLWRKPLDLPPGVWRVVNLGTSSAVPTRKRNVSCTAFLVQPPEVSRLGEDSVTATNGDAEMEMPSSDPQKTHAGREPVMYLVDAGENTSARLEAAYWCMTHGFRWIRGIFVTHLHGDHIYGLPSLLQKIGRYAQFRRRRALENGDDESDPVIRVVGPYGTRGFIRTSLYWTPPLGVRFSVSELVPRKGDFAHLLKSRFKKEFKIVVNGATSDEFPNVDTEVPPPHPEEVRAADIEANGDGVWTVMTDDDGLGVEVVAAPLKHRVACFGYVFREVSVSGDETGPSNALEKNDSKTKTAGSEDVSVCIDMAKAKDLGVHGRQFSVLRSGRPVHVKTRDIVVYPEDVAAESTRDEEPGDSGSAKRCESNVDSVDNSSVGPRKVVILGDTCDSSAIAEAADGADLLLHEATFANSLADKAQYAMHSTASMAGAFARQIKAKKLVLFHFSSRYEAFHIASMTEESENGEDIKDTSLSFQEQSLMMDDKKDADNFTEEDEESLDDDLTSSSSLVQEASKAMGENSLVIAATDFMEHTVYRANHGDSAWRKRNMSWN